MLSAHNILSPAHGAPLATPKQDIVLGAYYLTYCEHDRAAGASGELAKQLGLKGLPRFRTRGVEFALGGGRNVSLQTPIEFRRGDGFPHHPGAVVFQRRSSGRSSTRCKDPATAGRSSSTGR